MRSFSLGTPQQTPSMIGGNLMALALTMVPIPLHTDAEGVVRVGGTRVTLDTVMAAFQAGATIADITRQYPSLQSADVYLVIGYCLHHRDEVEAYLKGREARAAEVRRQIEAQPDWADFQERLRTLRARDNPQE